MKHSQPMVVEGAPEKAETGLRLRVLIVAPSLGILGGQAVQAESLRTRLSSDAGVEVDFLAVNPELPGPLRAMQKVKYLRTLVTWPAYVASLLLRVPHHDVIHIFSASYLSFVLAPTPAIFVSRLYGRKTVLNYHSGEAEDHLRRWRTAVPVIRLADEIAVPSGYLVDVFRQFGLQARAIFNTVDADRFRFRERRPLAPVFLSNRNLEPMYNVGCSLRAFALVKERVPQARLIVAGDGSQRRELEALAAELEVRDVRFLGRVPPDEMSRLYDEANICLNSSEIDNMPLSILEAFACGLPVITTDARGIPHIVAHEKTGLMVKRGDYRGMADWALRLLADDRLATDIVGNARRECARYDWEAVGSEWIDLYRSLLREPVRDEPAT